MHKPCQRSSVAAWKQHQAGCAARRASMRHLAVRTMGCQAASLFSQRVNAGMGSGLRTCQRASAGPAQPGACGRRPRWSGPCRCRSGSWSAAACYRCLPSEPINTGRLSLHSGRATPQHDNPAQMCSSKGSSMIMNIQRSIEHLTAGEAPALGRSTGRPLMNRNCRSLLPFVTPTSGLETKLQQPGWVRQPDHDAKGPSTCVPRCACACCLALKLSDPQSWFWSWAAHCPLTAIPWAKQQQLGVLLPCSTSRHTQQCGQLVCTWPQRAAQHRRSACPALRQCWPSQSAGPGWTLGPCALRCPPEAQCLSEVHLPASTGFWKA